MKTTHVRLKRSLLIATAGKVTLGATLAYGSGIGKTDSSINNATAVQPLSMDQFGTPLDLLTPPLSGLEASDVSATLGKAGGSTSDFQAFESSDSGVIWAGTLGSLAPPPSGQLSGGVSIPQDQPIQSRARIDFLIHGVRNDQPMLVILAYSTSPPLSDQQSGVWEPMQAGVLKLDPANLHIVAGIQIQPDHPAREWNNMPGFENNIGFVPFNEAGTIRIPVVLNDLQHPSINKDLYFQAISIPVAQGGGGYQWNLGQASEVDHYVIDRPGDATDGSVDTGSKTDARGGSSTSGTSGTGTGGKTTGGSTSGSSAGGK
jgi:hypothetical protein